MEILPFKNILRCFARHIYDNIIEIPSCITIFKDFYFYLQVHVGVWVYLCMHVYECVCIYVSMHACVFVCMCVSGGLGV